MQLLKMPLFEVLLPVIESNSIHNWTANDFWKQMKLTKKERHRFNRQRMYRILRKLVEFGFLDKELNQQHRKHPANTALPSDPISLNLVPT